jgi:ppGpp synthetase/RelA/SpoT-type nucleotidyltranferase
MTPSSSCSQRVTTLQRRAMYAIALMAAYNVTPSQCFGTTKSTVPSSPSSSSTTAQQQQQRSSSSSSTRRYFRSLDDNLAALKTTGVGVADLNLRGIQTSLSTEPSSSSTVYNKNELLPIWLREEKSHLLESNFVQLKTAMEESFFSENEIQKLTYAIVEASTGNANRKAGAAEFCLVLVETMEMGLNALVAAAFHYCACVSARERTCSTTTGSKLAPWEFPQHSLIETFGKHALQIERDAARLKRLEIVAHMVVQDSESVGQVSLTRAEADNLSKLYLTESKDWRALAIRSAACLFRLRGILASGEPKLNLESIRVSREALYIYAPLASRLGMHRLKNELEGAAFQILYKRQYETVRNLQYHTSSSASALSRKGLFGKHVRAPPPTSGFEQAHAPPPPQVDIADSMQRILTNVQKEMTEMLQQDAAFSSQVASFTVTARVKEAYSTWKKMLKNRNNHILQVPDAIALRIILHADKNGVGSEDAQVTAGRERALCYYAQKLCQERWKPDRTNPRFKDYIESPKPNGYQSLHYTAATDFEGEEWSLEIQVRSEEMHKVAEFGLASHWDYKARAEPTTTSTATTTTADEHSVTITGEHYFGRNTPLITSSDAYLKRLHEWHWSQRGGAFETDASPTSDEYEPLNNVGAGANHAESQVRADRIRARTQRLAPYIEALTEAQSDLAREHVFVFFNSPSTSSSTSGTGTTWPQQESVGKVLSLPAGAVVLDALREVKKNNALPTSSTRYNVLYSLAIDEQDIRHNGLPAVLTSRLRNGDMLSIPSSVVPTTTTLPLSSTQLSTHAP